MKHILYILLLFISIGTSAKERGENSIKLKVLSYNIHHGEGVDGKIDLDRIAGIIKASSADVVALQEVDIKTKRSGYVNQLKKLAELCHMNFAFGKAMDWEEGEYGNAVLSKYPILKQNTFILPGEPRSALVSTLKLDKHLKIVFISLHLDVDLVPRENSVQPLFEIVNQYDSVPLILAGDLNTQPETKVLTQLKSILKNATEDILTFPVSIPNEQIDYIMYSPKHDLKVCSAKALDEKIASDHRPVMSVLEIHF